MRRLWTALVLAPLAALVLCWNLGEGSLQGDEALYVAVVTETAESGRRLPLRVDGADYVSKPIGGFVPMRLAIDRVAPVELAARLPSVLAAWLLVLLVGDAAARWFGGGSGVVAGLLLVTAQRPLDLHGFRSGTFEAFLVLSISATVVFWIESRRRESRPLWCGACAAGALSVLFKYLAAPALAGVSIFAGEIALGLRARPLRLRTAWVRAGQLLGAAVLAYAAYVGLLALVGADGLVGELFHRDLVRRAQGNLHRFRQPGPEQFTLDLAADLGLALLPLVPFVFGLRRRWRDARVERPELVAWIGVAALAAMPLLAVSLFRSRLPWYSLPAYPGFALAVAAGLSELGRWRIRPAWVAAFGVTLVALQAVDAYAFLQRPVPDTPLRHLGRALDQVPEARLFISPSVGLVATSERGIVRPVSAAYLRRLGARATPGWPEPGVGCAVVYIDHPKARRMAAQFAGWMPLEMPRASERHAERFLLLDGCGGRIVSRVMTHRFQEAPPGS